MIVGYTPLGRSDLLGTPDFPIPSILDEKVTKIAQKYKKTPAQIVLNYLVSVANMNFLSLQFRYHGIGAKSLIMITLNGYKKPIDLTHSHGLCVQGYYNKYLIVLLHLPFSRTKICFLERF